MAPRDPTTYFCTVRPFWMGLIAAAFIYYSWAVFAPSTIPYDVLGPLGRFTKYLQENHRTAFHAGLWLTCVIHIGEALLSLWLCKIKGITDSRTQLQWFTQTLLFGIASFNKGITDSRTQLQWFTQTLFFGMASLYFLFIYKPQRKSY